MGKLHFNEQSDKGMEQGIYIRWQLRNRCERKEQSLLFDLSNALDKIESIHKSDFFSSEKTYIRVQHVLSYHLI